MAVGVGGGGGGGKSDQKSALEISVVDSIFLFVWSQADIWSCMLGCRLSHLNANRLWHMFVKCVYVGQC